MMNQDSNRRSINVRSFDADLWKRFRMVAIERNLTIGQLLAEVIGSFLREVEK